MSHMLSIFFVYKISESAPTAEERLYRKLKFKNAFRNFSTNCTILSASYKKGSKLIFY